MQFLAFQAMAELAALSWALGLSLRSVSHLVKALGKNYASGAFEDFEGAPHAEDFAFIQLAREVQSGQASPPLTP